MNTGRAVRAALEAAADDALMLAGKAVLESAKKKAPVGDPSLDPDPGASLQANNSVTRIDDDVVMVKFDGPYAAYQHENRSLSHPRGGGPQFLSDALKEQMPLLAGIVAGRVRAEVKRRH